jgi:hypothetical protein
MGCASCGKSITVPTSYQKPEILRGRRQWITPTAPQPQPSSAIEPLINQETVEEEQEDTEATEE